MTEIPAHGNIVWNELNSHNPGAAKAFYARLMGWGFEPMPIEGGGDYWIITKGEARLGGLFPMVGDEFRDVPAHWLTYIAIDDVDARLKEAVAAGGSVTRPGFDIPGVGRIAIVRDAEGAYMGWITPKM